jgi:hypothetical protein
VQASTSYLSSSESIVHFGLGAATNYDWLEIIWPDGDPTPERFPGGPVGRRVVVYRGEGAPITGSGREASTSTDAGALSPNEVVP